jgi:hypothetical protein
MDIDTHRRTQPCLFEDDNKPSHFNISHTHSHPILFYHIQSGLRFTLWSLASTSLNLSHCSNIFTISIWHCLAAICNAVHPSYEAMTCVSIMKTTKTKLNKNKEENENMLTTKIRGQTSLSWPYWDIVERQRESTKEYKTGKWERSRECQRE